MNKEQLDLVFAESIQENNARPEKALPALLCLAITLFLALGLGVKLSIALLTGAVGMVLTRVLAIDEAYASVLFGIVTLAVTKLVYGIAG